MNKKVSFFDKLENGQILITLGTIFFGDLYSTFLKMVKILKQEYTVAQII